MNLSYMKGKLLVEMSSHEISYTLMYMLQTSDEKIALHVSFSCPFYV